MTVSSKEKDFEDAIVKVLHDGGYEDRKPSNFRTLAKATSRVAIK